MKCKVGLLLVGSIAVASFGNTYSMRGNPRNQKSYKKPNGRSHQRNSRPQGSRGLSSRGSQKVIRRWNLKHVRLPKTYVRLVPEVSSHDAIPVYRIGFLVYPK